jgi:hypothetical protein
MKYRGAMDTPGHCNALLSTLNLNHELRAVF